MLNKHLQVYLDGFADEDIINYVLYGNPEPEELLLYTGLYGRLCVRVNVWMLVQRFECIIIPSQSTNAAVFCSKWATTRAFARGACLCDTWRASQQRPGVIGPSL